MTSATREDVFAAIVFAVIVGIVVAGLFIGVLAFANMEQDSRENKYNDTRAGQRALCEQAGGVFDDELYREFIVNERTVDWCWIRWTSQSLELGS